ncbi:hypothetical protein HG536_0B04790 [Torulaspora globosa]|uniref:Oxo-4-hydroxy-4-carboxy-5-ureidoimidazoline decarboxylase domain-containing protein n=1 Tax=Torulaspora globosa TaxID=48254 RepID=A0A7G3ZDM9_9SACH|nr:uncharacterized protein HG536_0B04790 [Torulaspora globosa]QLL31615.1 hypothetical protein HG536_0B04790 [Torulaspora globosa]
MLLPSYDNFINCENFSKQAAVVEDLFEPSYSILKFTLRDDDFMHQARRDASNYGEFIELIRSKLLQISHNTEKVGPSSRDVDHLADIVSAHPRLGESVKRLSAHSEKEQRNLSNSNDPAEIREKLAELNEDYEQAYPGLRFVVFVNGRSRSEIIKVMQERIASGNSWFGEVDIAINELCCIALDRVKKWESSGFKL